MENDPAWKAAASAFETAKRLDGEKNKLVWLDRAPANNTWLIAVRGDLARREKLATMEDFAKLSGGAGAHQARGLGRVRREPGGPAVLREGLRLQAARATRSSCCRAATPR